MVERRPLVSIIIPAFNAEQTIAESMFSALNQTYGNTEIIVVDDGSTDGTGEITAAFAAREPKVTLLKQVNSGVSSARNAGIARARGVFIAPLDADDLWHPTKLARQVEAALRSPEPPGFVYAWTRRIDMAGRVIDSQRPSHYRGHVAHRHVYENFVGTGSSVLWSRSALSETAGYDEAFSHGEDYLLQLQIATHHPVEVVAEYLVGYRLTPGSLSLDKDGMLEAWPRIRKRVLQLCPHVPTYVHDWAHGRRCALHAETRAWQGRPFSCALLLGQGLWFDPGWTLSWLSHRLRRRMKMRTKTTAESHLETSHFSRWEASTSDYPQGVDDLKGPRASQLENRRLRHLQMLDEETQASVQPRSVP